MEIKFELRTSKEKISTLFIEKITVLNLSNHILSLLLQKWANKYSEYINIILTKDDSIYTTLTDFMANMCIEVAGEENMHIEYQKAYRHGDSGIEFRLEKTEYMLVEEKVESII